MNASDGLFWRRASRCNNGECAEVAALPDGGVALRSTVNPDQVASFTRDEWAVLVDAVKAGEFDPDTF